MRRHRNPHFRRECARVATGMAVGLVLALGVSLLPQPCALPDSVCVLMFWVSPVFFWTGAGALMILVPVLAVAVKLACFYTGYPPSPSLIATAVVLGAAGLLKLQRTRFGTRR
jgi:hypothetical protein